MKKSRILNFVCAGLAFLLLILQMFPFWQYGGGEASIQGYVWNPEGYSELEDYFGEAMGGEYPIGRDPVSVLLAITLLAAGTIVFCLWKNEKPLAAILPGACGIVGIWGYLSSPILRLGADRWLHICVCVLMVAAAVMAPIFGLKNRRQRA